MKNRLDIARKVREYRHLEASSVSMLLYLDTSYNWQKSFFPQCLRSFYKTSKFLFTFNISHHVDIVHGVSDNGVVRNMPFQIILIQEPS